MGPTAQGYSNWTLGDRGRPQRDLFEPNKLLYFRPLHRKKISHFTFFLFTGFLKLTPPPPPPKKNAFNCENSVHDVNLKKKKDKSRPLRTEGSVFL